jgi:DNA-binding NarL/FixJ family response regulator
MNKDILVAVLEDDVFSRNWMALLMVRDWRTRIVGEFSNQIELCSYLNSNSPYFDILLIDVDLLTEKFTISEICRKLSESKNHCKILLTGVTPDSKIIRQFPEKRLSGYITKKEAGFSLSWIITFAYEGHFVITPGIMEMLNEANYLLPENTLVVDGRTNLPGFTDHEAEVARLAFIFSLGRRDLADELKISEQWSYGLVSELYKKMGLTDILNGDQDLFSYIGESAIIRSHFEEILSQLGPSKKAKDLETLAYHLLTMPEIIN